MQSLHEAQFIRRGGAREHANLMRDFGEFFVANLREFLRRQREFVRAARIDSHVLRDRDRCRLRVPRNHLDLYSRAAT